MLLADDSSLCLNRRQGNFHMFYYFFDYLSAKRELPKYMLESGQRYRYLRQVATPSGCNAFAVPSDPNNASSNCKQFESILHSLSDLEFGADNMETMKKMLAAILLLGEVRFRDGGGNKAEVENPKVAAQGIMLQNCSFITKSIEYVSSKFWMGKNSNQLFFKIIALLKVMFSAEVFYI